MLNLLNDADQNQLLNSANACCWWPGFETIVLETRNFMVHFEKLRVPESFGRSEAMAINLASMIRCKLTALLRMDPCPAKPTTYRDSMD